MAKKRIKFAEQAKAEAYRKAIRPRETAVENAVRLGVSVPTVYRWAKRLGIGLRVTG